MGIHEPVYPEALGPKTVQEKAYNHTKIAYNQEKAKKNFWKQKKYKKQSINKKRSKTLKNYRNDIFFPTRCDLTSLFVVVSDCFLSFLIERSSVLVVG